MDSRVVREEDLGVQSGQCDGSGVREDHLWFQGSAELKSLRTYKLCQTLNGKYPMFSGT